MKARFIAIVFCALVIFYAISFGPGVYVIVKAEKHINNYIPDPVQNTVVVIYFPHLYLMAFSELYFNYAVWYVKMAGENSTITYPEFRKRYIKEN